MSNIILILLGLCFGSFVNALVWRLRQAETTSSKLKDNDLSILHGRSMCIHCRHTLAWYDLLPVLSWVSLRGKCRYCKKPISWQYPIVELITSLLFVLSYATWPFRPISGSEFVLFSLWLIFLTGFMALIVYDLKWMTLPDKIVIPLTALAVFHVLVRVTTDQDFNVIVGSVMGLVAVGGLFYLLFQISDGKWIGGGDVKLGFMLGLLAGGLVEGLMVIFIASLLGTIAAVPLIGRRQLSRKAHIPFGPFLITGLFIVYLYSSRILDWYQQYFIV